MTDIIEKKIETLNKLNRTLDLLFNRITFYSIADIIIDKIDLSKEQDIVDKIRTNSSKLYNSLYQNISDDEIEEMDIKENGVYNKIYDKISIIDKILHTFSELDYDLQEEHLDVFDMKIYEI